MRGIRIQAPWGFYWFSKRSTLRPGENQGRESETSKQRRQRIDALGRHMTSDLGQGYWSRVVCYYVPR